MSDPNEQPAGPDAEEIEDPSAAAEVDGAAGEADGEDVGSDTEEQRTSSREELYRRFGFDEDEDEESDASEEQDDEPSPAAEDEQDEDPPAEDPSHPTDEQKPPDEAMLGRVPDSEWKSLTKQTQQRINALRASRKQLKEQVSAFEEQKPLVEFGDSILGFAEKNQINLEHLYPWLELGAVVNRGGEEAVNALIATAERLGYQPHRARAADPPRQASGRPAEARWPMGQGLARGPTGDAQVQGC